MSSFIDFLSVYDVLFLHEKLIKRFGGLHGLRDLEALEAALYQPQMVSQAHNAKNNGKVNDNFLPFFSTLSYDEYLNKDIFQMAATYSYQIIRNHPFIDGNKRTGILSAITFLEKNGLITHANPEDLYQLTTNIVESKITREEAAQFFKSNMR
jgi:death on curing protein